MDVTRRAFGGLIGAAAVPVAGLAAARPLDLDLVTPEGQLAAWLKVYVSLGKVRVWYWYTGVIDGAVEGGPVLPLVGVSTLIRRDMTPLGGGRHRMEMFEGSYFHGIEDPAPLDRWMNPLNGREVRPFHYREGPYVVGYDRDGGFDIATGSRLPGGRPFTRWHGAGDQIWFSRDYYIDAPHPLSLADWPMEASGARERVGSFATHWASRAEVADPAVLTASSAFSYEAFMGWWPWMLMAQAPGRLVWRAAGTKLRSLDDMPAGARAGFRKTHPRLFEERPWEELANMASDYRKLRTPAPR